MVRSSSVPLLSNDIENEDISFALSAVSFSQTQDFGRTSFLDTTEASIKALFKTNVAFWNTQTNMLSDNNLDNEYFNAIVEMGLPVVPLIKEELEKEGPSMLVYALDRIMPNTIVPKSYLPLPILCNLWLNFLNQQ